MSRSPAATSGLLQTRTAPVTLSASIQSRSGAGAAQSAHDRPLIVHVVVGECEHARVLAGKGGVSFSLLQARFVAAELNREKVPCTCGHDWSAYAIGEGGYCEMDGCFCRCFEADPEADP